MHTEKQFYLELFSQRQFIIYLLLLSLFFIVPVVPLTEINSQVNYVYLTVIPNERNSLHFIPAQEMGVRTLPRSLSYPLIFSFNDL